tara:strand:+ start:903 stop:1175 length:273 start_codon:yes stop_codon:yes gene_type:complete
MEDAAVTDHIFSRVSRYSSQWQLAARYVLVRVALKSMCTLAKEAGIQLYTMPRLVRAMSAIPNSERQLRYFDAYWNQIPNRWIELGELSS